MTPSELETIQSQTPSPIEKLADEENKSKILTLINQLPANQREVMQLKFQEDLSYQEISHITRLSTSNIGFLLHTALNTIRDQMIAASTK